MGQGERRGSAVRAFLLLGRAIEHDGLLLLGEFKLPTDTCRIVVGDGTGWTRSGYAVLRMMDGF
jgi:hypothetical protein